MNKKTTCITDDQFNRIVNILYKGEDNIKPNKEMALIFTLTGNCGLRIGDCLSLTLDSFIEDGDDFRYNITEEKTGKKRTTLIPKEIYNKILEYALNNNRQGKTIFHYTTRSLQLKLKEICDYLGYKNVSTHSFRKHAGMNVYKKSGHNIELTRKFLNHSSISVTQRYLGVDDEEVNNILRNNYTIPFAV